MALFVTFIVFTLLAIALLIVSRLTGKAAERPRRRWWRLGSIVALALALACLFFSSFTIVGTKNVAVLTFAGRPVGYLDNGWHWKAPWEKPHEISDAVQTDTYASDPESITEPQGGATDTCVHVRIERQATACVNVSIRWQIRDTGVEYLFRNYKSNEHIQDNVVLRDLQQAMNQQFSSYDPLGIDAEGNNTNKPLTVYARAVQTQMRTEIGRWIDVQSVIVPFLNYDDQTQQKVNQLLQQIALTRVAIQQKQTAIAQAAANRALTASVSDNPNVLVSRCLDILKEAVDKGLDVKAFPSCFGGSNVIPAVGVK